MISFKLRSIPLALASLTTSTLMYGAAPYTIASSGGGPVKDDLGEIISISEAPLNNALSYEAIVVNTADTMHGSLWQTTGHDKDNLTAATDAFPIGSRTVTIQFTITNNSMSPVDIYGLHIRGWYEGSKWLASPVTPTNKAKHVEMGYPEYLLDIFGLEKDEWIIPPNETVVFAETFYADNDAPLNLQIILPQKDGNSEGLVSANFQLH